MNKFKVGDIVRCTHGFEGKRNIRGLRGGVERIDKHIGMVVYRVRFMTAPLSAERVEELRLRIEHLQYLFSADRVDLDAILSSYSSLRAEVKRLKKAIDETGRLDTERIQTVARRKP